MALMNSTDEETSKQQSGRERPLRSSGFAAFSTETPTTKRATTRKPTPSPVLAPPQMPTWYTQLAAWLDAKSRGHGEEVMRVLSFLVIGGSASVLNLICFALIRRLFGQDRYELLPYIITSILSTEISLLYNFMLNDRFTFRSMNDGSRTWIQRCIRFHGPASVGFALTLIIGATLNNVVHLPATVSQGIAIIFVTAVNFMMHRFWTFRPNTKTVLDREDGETPPAYLALED